MSENVFVVVDRGEGISTPVEQSEFYVVINRGQDGGLGYTGSQGDVGYTGSQGAGFTGSQGDVGYAGSVGYTGSTGFTGSAGFTGSKGDTGSIGYTGSTGFTGSVGYTGSAGNTGQTGFTGSVGYTGSAGEVGFTGSKGDTGSIGYTGSIGFTGSKGDIGQTGFTGSIGYTGSQGAAGSAGYTGSQGDVGYTGSQGQIGYTGSAGFTGSQGIAGFTGSQGGLGYTGSQGPIGYTGSANWQNIAMLGFDTTTGYQGSQPGDLFWDSGNGTLALRLAGNLTTVQLGQEEVVRVFNATGSTLTDGQVVYVSGAQGNRPAVMLASASNEASSSVTLGVVTEPISPGAEGFITTSGMVNGLNTSAYAEGVALWLSDTVPGGVTTTRPVAPAHAVMIGYVVRSHMAAGSIFVKIQNGYELNELHDVLITTPTAGQVLGYDGSVWKNVGTVAINDGSNTSPTDTWSANKIFTEIGYIGSALDAIIG